MTLAVFVLALLSSLRLVRLGVEDTITQPFRNFLARRSARGGRIGHAWLWLVQLFECPWCLGFWVAGAVTTLAAAATDHGHTAGWFIWPAVALAISYLIGFISTVLFTVEEI